MRGMLTGRQRATPLHSPLMSARLKTRRKELSEISYIFMMLLTAGAGGQRQQASEQRVGGIPAASTASPPRTASHREEEDGAALGGGRVRGARLVDVDLGHLGLGELGGDLDGLGLGALERPDELLELALEVGPLVADCRAGDTQEREG